MTRRARIRTVILIVIFLTAISSSAWAGARYWSKSITAHYRNNLSLVVDGRRVTPEVAPFIIDPGYLMVPAEFIAKELGAQVEWDDETSTLSIYRAPQSALGPGWDAGSDAGSGDAGTDGGTAASPGAGSAGDGLFSMNSELIGITTLIFKDSQNLNLVVPVSYVQELLAKPTQLTPYPSMQKPASTEGTNPVARYFEEASNK